MAADDGDDEKALLLGRSADGVREPRRSHRATLPVHWVAALFDGADGRLLPALFRALEKAFGVGPSALSSLMVGQSLAAALCTPVWANYADTARSRIYLLTLGCALWGLWSILCSFSVNFSQLFVFKLLTGSALCAIAPISQSIVADIVPQDRLGWNFGVIGFWASIGNMVGTLVATNFGERTMWSIEGWRLVTAIVGVLSIAFAATIPCLASDPRQDAPPQTTVPPPGSPLASLKEAARKASDAFRLPTFQLILLQGCFGAIPFNAMAFTTMWLQWIGLSNLQASVVSSVGIIGGGVGNLLGGYLGDEAARRYPDTGRVRVAQISILCGIVFSPIIYYALPHRATYAPGYATLFFVQAACMSWCAVAANRPIFCDLATPTTRATILAWEVAIESTSASLLGAPLVGLLAERIFDYDTSISSKEISDLPLETRERNAQALGRALLTICIVPWTFCVLIYGLVARSYPRDRDALRASQAARTKGGV